jgi:cytochrome c oxidase assembly protein subunit 15
MKTISYEKTYIWKKKSEFIQLQSFTLINGTLPLQPMIKKSNSNSSRAVAIWLFIGVGMLIFQVLLGGITRLTGSGLSITEWNIITRNIPPLNEHQWLLEFEKYKQTDQFRYVNFDFTLPDFKFIFFWEWLHRLWAQLIGIAFIIPFIIFLVQRRIKREMIKPFIILFLLGGLQGLVGWIMVLSGLEGNAIYVAPTRLALHFIFAIGLICYTFWFALQVSIPDQKKINNSSLNRLTWVILLFTTIQLIFGSLMAGHKAATYAYTWPDINGSFFPPDMFNRGMISIIENKITIHFIHRNIGYIILVLVLGWTFAARRINVSSFFNKIKFWPLVLILLQVVLGILAVVSSVKIMPNRWGGFEWTAQLHQLNAIFFLLSLVLILFVVRNKDSYLSSQLKGQ